MFATLATAVRVGLDVLRENPLRTLLSTLGVIIGVASLVAVLALGDGMTATAREEIERTTGVQVVIVEPKTSETVDGQTVPRFEYPTFTPADARAAAREIDGVRAHGLTIDGSAWIASAASGRQRRATVQASLASQADFVGLRFAVGRFFTAAEERRTAPVVVLSHRLARELAGGRAPETLLGATVRVGATTREVIGILAPAEHERGYRAVVPLGAASAVFGPSATPRPPTLYLKAARVEDVAPLAARATDWLAGRYTRWQRRVTVTTDQARLAQALNGIATFRLFMGAITGISLLVGGIGIMNVLLASVTERTREIGIRKATGARGRDVLLQFLAESVTISGAGSAVGILLGVAGAYGFTAIIRANVPDVPLRAGFSGSTLLAAAASAIVVGLVFGTYPARRAARLSPIDAIRHE